jgi:hypothetical protein
MTEASFDQPTLLSLAPVSKALSTSNSLCSITIAESSSTTSEGVDSPHEQLEHKSCTGPVDVDEVKLVKIGELLYRQERPGPVDVDEMISIKISDFDMHRTESDDEFSCACFTVDEDEGIERLLVGYEEGFEPEITDLITDFDDDQAVYTKSYCEEEWDGMPQPVYSEATEERNSIFQGWAL